MRAKAGLTRQRRGIDRVFELHALVQSSLGLSEYALHKTALSEWWSHKGMSG